MSNINRVVQKSINSKKLFKEIDDFVQEAIDITGVRWGSAIHRSALVDLVEAWLHEEIYGNGKITQFNVMCDERNNPLSLTRENKYRFEVSFKQRNCLNTSSIEYQIDESSDIGDNVSDTLYP